MQLEWKLDWIQIPKLNSIELNTTFFSFQFNMVRIFSGISIQLNLVKLNQIQLKTNLLKQICLIILLSYEIMKFNQIMKIQWWKGTC
jgi:hypothetical protein